jgi:serine/threonine protein phosphatase 1
MNHNIPTIKNKFHHHYTKNIIGTDYIVGDISGCYDSLTNSLNLLNFNPLTDRLFSVGDIIDKGPQSLQSSTLIYENFFHTTKGNHEHLMIMATLTNSKPHHQTWIQNGGNWHTKISHKSLIQLARDFNELPLIITVETGLSQFNIVHAELIKESTLNNPDDVVRNKDIEKWKFNSQSMHNMIWGRNIISSKNLNHTKRKIFNIFQSKSLNTTYVGHTPTKLPIQIEQQIYIDTGHSNNFTQQTESFPLTITSPHNNTFYLFYKNSITTLSHITKY